jgi:hypothetical protein
VADPGSPHCVVALVLKEEAVYGQVDSELALDEEEHCRAALGVLPVIPFLAGAVNGPLDLNVLRHANAVCVVEEVPDDPASVITPVDMCVAEVPVVRHHGTASIATCPPFVVEALRRRRDLQELERAAAREPWSERWAAEGLVFTTVNGTPLDTSNLRRYFHRACCRAGIGRWTPYEMRHSAASLLSAQGVPLELVANTLGHDGTRMSALVYRHAVTPTVDVAVAPMERLLGNRNGGGGEPTNDFGSPNGSLGSNGGKVPEAIDAAGAGQEGGP